jgi:gas vesicle protein
MDKSDNHNHDQPETGAAPTPEAAFEVPAGQAGGHGPGFLLGTLMGTLVGAGLASILTPVRGEEVRARTAEKAPELWRRRGELARELGGGVRSRLGEALEAGREAAGEAQQEARRRYERMSGRQSGPPLP